MEQNRIMKQNIFKKKPSKAKTLRKGRLVVQDESNEQIARRKESKWESHVWRIPGSLEIKTNRILVLVVAPNEL
jgi:hypothetical protein